MLSDYYPVKPTNTPVIPITSRALKSKNFEYHYNRARSLVFDIHSPATEMELYACGKNEASNLNLPRVCIRWHVLGSNPCEHNNYCRAREDPSYCPRMVTRLTYVLNDEDIRFVIKGNGFNCNSTVLDLGGELKCFGSEPSASDDLKTLPRIVNIVRTEYGEEMLFLDVFARIWYLPAPYAGGKATLTKKTAAPGNEILLIASSYGDGKISVVTKSRPRTVLTFSSCRSSYKSFLEWYSANEIKSLVGSLDFPSPVKEIVANHRYMTVLTEDHDVFTWSSVFDTVPIPVESTAPSEKSALSETSKTPSPEDEEEEEDGPDMSDLLDDEPPDTTSTQVIPQEETAHYTKMPLPPTSKLDANLFITAALARQRLYLWCTPEGHALRTHNPIIPSLGDSTLPRLQHIVDDETGKPLAITDVSVGKFHIIALTADGSIFSIGRGWYGELGIGPRYFDLRVEEREGSNYDQEDAVEFAETWQRMETEGVLGDGMQWVEIMAGDQVSWALARKKVCVV